MAGVFIGIGCGLLEFFLLSKFTKAVTSGRDKLPAALLFFAILSPVVVILPCAFILPSQIHLMGIAAASALIICSLIKFIPGIRKSSKGK